MNDYYIELMDDNFIICSFKGSIEDLYSYINELTYTKKEFIKLLEVNKSEVIVRLSNIITISLYK